MRWKWYILSGAWLLSCGTTPEHREVPNEESTAAGEVKATVPGCQMHHTIGAVDYRAMLRENEENGSRWITFAIHSDSVRGDFLKSLSANAEEYETHLKYCSFGIGNDLSLKTTTGATYPCQLAIFERTYGMKPGLTFTLHFDTIPEEDYALVFQDKLLHNGPVYLRCNE